MNKLVILALALFATLVQGGGLYGAGPLIQQVQSLPNLPQVTQLLGGSAIASAASSPAQVYAAKPLLLGGLGYARGYARPSVAYAPVRSVVVPSVRSIGPVYGVGQGLSGLGYGARSGLGLGYGAPRYGARLSVQPAIATQLTGGPTLYKTYQSPPTYSTVALPVLPSAPVAKLFVPKRTVYGGPVYGVGPIAY